MIKEREKVGGRRRESARRRRRRRRKSIPDCLRGIPDSFTTFFTVFFLLSLFFSFFPEQTSSRPPSLLCFLEWTEGEKGQKRGKGNVNCEAQGREEKGRADAAGQTHRKMLVRNKSARSRAANWPQIAPEAAAKGRVSLSSLVGLCGIAFLWERRMQFFPHHPTTEKGRGEGRRLPTAPQIFIVEKFSLLHFCKASSSLPPLPEIFPAPFPPPPPVPNYKQGGPRKHFLFADVEGRGINAGSFPRDIFPT